MRVGVLMYETSLTKGQELVAQRMVKELRREGTDAYLITSIFHDYEEVVSIEEVEERGGYMHSFDETLDIPVVRVASRKGDWPPRRITFTDFVSVLSRIVDDLRLDVLITHSTLWNGPEETAKFVEWRRNQSKGGAPVRPIVFCHMSHFQEPSDERYDLEERTFRQAWNQVSLPMILKATDFVLVTTPREKELMKEIAGVGDEKFVLFPGGIDTSTLEFGRVADFKLEHGIPAETKLVSFVGSVEERKNPKALLKIAEALQGRRDVVFVIGGKLEGSYGAEVKGASTSLPNVLVTGPLSEAEYRGLIRQSYLNINMSRSEALGLAQIEFMYEGVPVITSGVGGQAWVVKDGATGLIVKGPDDLQGAADAVAALVDDPRKRDRLARQAKKAAQDVTMPVLLRQLTKKISTRLFVDAEGQRGLEPDEKLIEAWVKKGYKVAVTTKKLLVDSAWGGAQQVIPLAEIVRFERRRRFAWQPFAVGALASLIIYAVVMSDPPATASLKVWLLSLTPYMTSEMARYSVWVFALLPVAVASAFLLLTSTEGYQILYGVKRTLFLPMDFAKALRIADELTPQNLFQPEQIP